MKFQENEAINKLENNFWCLIWYNNTIIIITIIIISIAYSEKNLLCVQHSKEQLCGYMCVCVCVCFNWGHLTFFVCDQQLQTAAINYFDCPATCWFGSGIHAKTASQWWLAQLLWVWTNHLFLLSNIQVGPCLKPSTQSCEPESSERLPLCCCWESRAVLFFLVCSDKTHPALWAEILNLESSAGRAIL